MTKSKFLTYYAIQMSGLTNMFDIRQVVNLSGTNLQKSDCLDIMKNYSKYLKEYKSKVDQVSELAEVLN